MLCLDTYALVEIARDNPKFTKFNRHDFVLTDLTVAEFYGIVLRNHNEQTARYWFRQVSPNSQAVSKELLVEAVKFRFANKKKNLSFFDCVGYVYARHFGYRFLTGDKEFKSMKGVEFVK